ncbi:MAG: VanZ family protein [Chthoniobacteraceae bacterium]
MTNYAPRPIPRWLVLLAWLGVAIWVTAISILSSMRPDQLEKLSSVKFWDKAEHFIAFAAGAANLALVLRWSTAWPAARVALVAIAGISFFAAMDEIHQLYTPGRSGGDVGDWTADTLGAATGVWLTLQIYARSPRPRLPAPSGA